MNSTAGERNGGVSLRWRLLLVTVGGIVAGVGVSAAVGWRYGLLSGWMVASAGFLSWMWATIWPMDQHHTASHARQEDAGRAVIDLIVLSASVVSLLAIGLVLAGSGNRITQALLSVVSVALAWGVVHTMFATRYARLYYAEPLGGIGFNQDDPPQYSDFAYFAFTVGMTFQVSDTEITTKEIRAVTLRHALLSYLFGAVILAITINLVAGLGK